MPISAKVTLVANASDGVEFLGWMNENGVVLSTSETYTFATTGNDYAEAVYKTELESASLVIFKNDKAAGGNQPGAALLKGKLSSGVTYYAKTWVIYKDAQGVEHTAYSDLLVIDKL